MDRTATTIAALTGFTRQRFNNVMYSAQTSPESANIRSPIHVSSEEFVTLFQPTSVKPIKPRIAAKTRKLEHRSPNHSTDRREPPINVMPGLRTTT